MIKTDSQNLVHLTNVCARLTAVGRVRKKGHALVTMRKKPPGCGVRIGRL